MFSYVGIQKLKTSLKSFSRYEMLNWSRGNNILQQHCNCIHNHQCRTNWKPDNHSLWFIDMSCDSRCNTISKCACAPPPPPPPPPHPPQPPPTPPQPPHHPQAARTGTHDEACSPPISSPFSPELLATLGGQLEAIQPDWNEDDQSPQIRFIFDPRHVLLGPCLDP